MNNKKLYSMQAVDKFLNENAGIFEIYTLPGCLLDSYLLIDPAGKYKSMLILETYVNSWSSAYRVMRFSKITKQIAGILAEFVQEYYSDLDCPEYMENLEYLKNRILKNGFLETLAVF